MLGKKAMVIVLISILINLCFIIRNLHAQDNAPALGIEISGDYAVYSAYVWRGFVLDKDPVLQPGVSIGLKGITVSLWSSMDMSNSEGTQSDEIDYTVDYTVLLKRFNFSIGHTYYNFSGVNLHTREFYMGVAYEGPLSPSITWYHDYGDEDNGGGDGDYYALALSHCIPIRTGITIDLGGHVGHNRGLFIQGTGGDIVLSAGLGVALKESLSITPTITYSIPFGDLEDETDGNQEKKSFGGIALAYQF